MASNRQFDAGSDPGLVAEGFAFDDDRWLHQIRRAEGQLPLGTIGDYELLTEIGRGAQGIVYKAIQPRTKRRIALKRLVGGSLAGAEMRARLAREVEAAAALNHPSIVTVFGLEYVDGLPVLAMEWVDGEPVDAWSDRVGRDRSTVVHQLNLFQRICAGIEHAHERGVIHRDIKPTNILVDSASMPRILDFGLAKITGTDAQNPDLTATGGFVGTPAYAAPERLVGTRGISEVRSDVYSLGVVLYRMLTGRLPRRADVSLSDYMRTPWEEPLCPSNLNSALNPDLDAILLTALAAEPQRRYASVDKLADDIQRHLDGLPILAATASLAYRIRKKVRRHKLAIAVTGTITAILVTATILSATFALSAARARAEAVERTRIAESINEFLTDDLLAAIDPANSDNPDLTMREVLDRASAAVKDRFEDEPVVQAAIQFAIGRAYGSLGLAVEAVPHLEQAAELWKTTLGPRHADTRSAMRELAGMQLEADLGDEARVVIDELLDLDRSESGSNSPETMTTRYLEMLATAQVDTFEERLATLEQILDWNIRRHGLADPQTLDVAHTLANEYLYHKRASLAEPLLERMWETVRSVYPESHPQTLDVMLGRAVLFGRTGRDVEAVELLQDAVRIYRETKPAPFAPMGITLGHLGDHLKKLRRYDEAEAAFLEGYEILSAARGSDIGWAQGIVRMLADLYDDTGRPEEAARWRQKLVPEFRNNPPVFPPAP